MTDTSRQRVGDYELLELIGTGAQGSIYKAVCVALDNPHTREGEVTALKRLTGDAKDEEKYFLRQAEILQRLQHPNIVAYREIFVLNKGSFDESKCMVMEFLDGESLNVTLDGFPEGLSWSKAHKIFLQVLDGLACAEREGVVHRDIKPSNIFQCKDGTVKLVDFGIARQVESGEVTTGGWKGSLDYMAPDFVVEKNFAGDAISDIYSLGVTFFRALSGYLPFSALSANASFEFFARWSTNRETSYPLGEILLQKNFRKLKRCVQLLPGLHDFLLKALCPVRAGRFQSFQEMKDALAVIGYARVQGAFNTYELVDLLGQGGFGKVFLGRVVQTGEYVAIKQLLSAVNERRFAREAEMLRKFGHPNIVNYIELVQASEGGGPDLRSYLIMENLPGMPQWSLRNRLKMSNGGLEVSNGLHIFARYLLAMNHMHRNGIIHRDIKPANLYAPEDDVANTKIFDFGIARESNSTLTQGSAPGTLDFMAPEFALQRDFKGSPSSDLYSIGLCLYETLTGKPPFERLSQSKMPVEAAFYMRAQSKPMPSFDHPVFREHPDLAEMMRKALHYNPRLRYRTCHAMLADVVAILDRLAGKPTGLLDGVPAPENPPEPDRIAEYEQAGEIPVEDAHEEELDTLATAFTGRTPDLAAKRPVSHVSSSGGGEGPELDTSPTAKIAPPAPGSKPEPMVYKGHAPVEELDPTQRDLSRGKRPAPTPPARASGALRWVAAAVLVLGLAGGGYWYMANRENPGRQLEQRLTTLLAESVPADPADAPVKEWARAFQQAESWVENHPEDSGISGFADELRERGRAWPKDVEAAFTGALEKGDLARAEALATSFASTGKDPVLGYLGLTGKTHERRLSNLREKLEVATASARAKDPAPVVPPVVPTPPSVAEVPPTLKPEPPAVAVVPPTMKPEVPSNVPPPDLEPGVQALRTSAEPSFAGFATAATAEDVHAGLDRLATAWVPAQGEVKTRVLGLDWWKQAMEQVTVSIRRVTARDGAENRASRLAAARKLLDHEMLPEWLAPALLSALRQEQQERESICWVDVVNESGVAVRLQPGSGLALPPLEIGPGEVQPLKLPTGTQEGTLLASPREGAGTPHTLALKPVPGTGIRLAIPAFAPMKGGIRLALRQPPTGPGVKAQVRDAKGTVLGDDQLADLPEGEYTASYLRPDYQAMKQVLQVKPGLRLELTGPEDAAWKPSPALAALRSAPADPEGLGDDKLGEWSKTLESLALTDPAHQAEAKALLAKIKARLQSRAPALMTQGLAQVDAWRDYFHQVGVFSGLAVILRSEDRRNDSRPAAFTGGSVGSDPASQRQELWRQASASKASRVEREAFSAKFDEVARSAEAAGDAALALACRVDAEILRTRRRRQPARELLDKAPVLSKVRAHAMFAGPEGLSGGVSPQDTVKDLLAYARTGGPLNKYDALLACYATFYAWNPSLTELEEDRRKYANDPDYQRNIVDMRRRNFEIAQHLAEILVKVPADAAQAAADVLKADAASGSWLLAAMPRFLAVGHPLHTAGRQWLKDNPVNRVDINATLDHVGLEAP